LVALVSMEDCFRKQGSSKECIELMPMVGRNKKNAAL